MDPSTIGIEHFLYVEDLELLVYVLIPVVAAVFLYGIRRYWRRWFREGDRPPMDRLGERFRRVLVYSIAQRKVLMKGYEGAMHLAIFLGTLLLLAATLLRALEYDVFVRLMDTRILTGNAYLAFKLMANVGGVLLVLGILMALYRRAVGMTRDLPNTAADYLVLGLLLAIAVTGFVLDSIATLEYRKEWIDGWDPVGTVLAGFFSGMEPATLRLVYRATWLAHMLMALGAIAAIPFTKLSHIVVGGLANTFFSRLEHPSAFKPVQDLDKAVETGKLGVQNLGDTTWKQRMDYDACIKCARCHNSCPANLSGKPLSPMNLILKMRELMDTEKWGDNIVPQHVEPDIVWSCVTCGACVYECPMLIHHVETITDLRRALFAAGENTPEELLQVSYNIMRTTNPYGFNPADRESWIQKLVDEGLVEVAREGEEYDYLYWVGCNVSYDPNLRGVGESLLKLLKKAGLRVAVLLEESCCGEPARRIGDELMFSELVKTNSEVLSKYRFKKLLVSCPHGFNVFKHEYPLYGFKVDVVHHSQVLADLVKSGKIGAGLLDATVTFHDPCYLGRWNNVYEEPRDVLRGVKGLKLVEMPRNRGRSFCCGGGGGQAFFEVKRGERISKLRMKEAVETGAKVVAVACPFCNVMLRSEAPEGVEVKDIAEILSESLEK